MKPSSKAEPATKKLLEVKYLAPDSLTGDSKNARTHSESQVGQIAASIVEFGFTNPILTDGKGGVIAGHGRLAAALNLGLDEVPTIALLGLTAAQKRAYLLADNKLALNAGWDFEMLRLELSELRELGFDLALTGFDSLELVDIFAEKTGRIDPDEAPALEVRAVSKVGDVWRLGPHRLACGDSTDANVVAQALGGNSPQLMVTDPPYGVNYDPNWRNQPGKLNLKSTTAMKSRTAATGTVMNDDRSDWTKAWELYRGDVAYVWHGERQGPELVGHMRVAGFEPRNLIIWAKSSLVISRGHYHPQHEGCWYMVRKGATGHWNGNRKQTTLWQIDKPIKSETGHGTQKPVECMKRPIENNSKPGEFVYEPFSGSGTTIIAAEMSGRAALAIELSPQYVDVAVRRWQSFTGKTAVLDSSGKSFGDVAKVRLKDGP